MRHRKKKTHIGRPADQRRALLRGLTTQLLDHGKLITTLSRAKALRSCAEKMITLGKRGDLHARRQALSFIYEKGVVDHLFHKVAPRYQEQQGGYTRIVKMVPRRGDSAPMASIHLV